MAVIFAMCNAIQYGYKNGRFILFVVCFFICALAFVAHAQPRWYKKPPNDAIYYYGVGMSTESMARAKDKAREELIKVISSTIEVKDKYTVHSKGDGKDEKIERKYSGRGRITAMLKSVPEVEISQSESNRQRTEHYALARLSRAIYRQYIKKEWDKVQEMVAHGDLSIGGRDVVTALREYSKALEMAQTLPFRDNHTSLSDVGIERKITRIQDDLDIEAISGNGQAGAYDGSLAEALVVQVHYQGSLLEAFPLWAVYRRGTGRLVNRAGETGDSVRTYTDVNGRATFWVEAIKSLSRENRIQVAAKHLPVFKAVDFHYTSSFSTRHSAQSPVIYLNDSADEQAFVENSAVEIEVRVPKPCHLHLFGILADGHFGYLQSVPIEQEYHGEGWRVLRKESNWALEIDESPVTAARGPGLETLLVIATAKRWQPVGKTLTPEGLIRRLNEDIGADDWRAGWASYLVRKDQ